MKIALDFDGTYTEDVVLWNSFVRAAKARGHQVKFVTFRYPDGDNQDIEDAASHLDIDIIYTSHKPKAEFYKAHIWIDDWPELIGSTRILKGD